MITRKKIVTVRQATWADNKDKAKVYWEQHWQSVRPEQAHRLKGELDDFTYTQLENNGQLVGIVAENESKELVGYMVIFIYPHHHHANELFAVTDAYFIDPEYRGGPAFGYMLAAAEDILKEKGIKYFQLTFTQKPDLRKFAEHKGFELSDYVCIKKL